MNILHVNLFQDQNYFATIANAIQIPFQKEECVPGIQLKAVFKITFLFYFPSISSQPKYSTNKIKIGSLFYQIISKF